jgi:sugar O-acyltransferase (sialic acid O-acetyltransferase NeuD family)
MQKKLLIVGAGGHGQVVADIFLQSNNAEYQISGFIDDNVSLHGSDVFGFSILGKISDIAGISHDEIIIAVGDNAKRSILYHQMSDSGEVFANAVHPWTQIARQVTPGKGCMICAGSIVNPGTRIGSNVILNTGCSVDHHNVIGDHCHIAPGVHLGGDVSTGQGVLVGIGATILPGCA